MGILDGVRIVELGRNIATPWMGMIMASLGAEVIKIGETEWLPDIKRHGPSSPDFSPTCMVWPDYAGGTKSFAVDMHFDEGLRLVGDLIKISDVFVNNFSLDAIAKWGLEGQHVKEFKPDIIMVQQPAAGVVGPYKDYVSYGYGMGALGGLANITGFPNSAPIAPGHSPADYHSGVNAAMLIVAALERHRRTGKGIQIELPLYESAVCVTGSTLLDYGANANIRQRIGNRNRYAAPHNAYPCKGEDCFCVITVFNDTEWAALCAVLMNSSLTSDARFSTVIGRLQNEDELDSLIADWTQGQDAEDVVEKLQKAGVGAGVVAKAGDLVDGDNHLRARGWWQWLDDPKWGRVPENPVPIRFSDTPLSWAPAPYIGEHNEYVCKELLKLPQEEFNNLNEKGVLSTREVLEAFLF